MVTLDIKNAFNTAPWETMMEELERREISQYLIGMIGAYLRGRTVISGDSELQMTCGVPQGSVLGPSV